MTRAQWQSDLCGPNPRPSRPCRSTPPPSPVKSSMASSVPGKESTPNKDCPPAQTLRSQVFKERQRRWGILLWGQNSRCHVELPHFTVCQFLSWGPVGPVGVGCPQARGKKGLPCPGLACPGAGRFIALAWLSVSPSALSCLFWLRPLLRENPERSHVVTTPLLPEVP